MDIQVNKLFPFKKILFTFLFNSSLFLLLIVGLQNNSNKSKVNLMIDKTIALPIGFIIGTSFISGSISGSFINLKFRNKN